VEVLNFPENAISHGAASAQGFDDVLLSSSPEYVGYPERDKT
jgi:hypothetical protein